MEPKDLIKLLKISADQGDQLITRLIEELLERGAIIDELEQLQASQAARQAATAAIVTEAALLVTETWQRAERRAMAGRRQGATLQ